MYWLGMKGIVIDVLLSQSSVTLLTFYIHK